MEKERPPEETAIDNLTKTQEFDREKLLDLARTHEDVTQSINKAEENASDPESSRKQPVRDLEYITTVDEAGDSRVPAVKRPMEKNVLKIEMDKRLHGKVLYNKVADKEFRFLGVEMNDPTHIGALKLQDMENPEFFTYLTEEDIKWQQMTDVNGNVIREALVSKDWELHDTAERAR